MASRLTLNICHLYPDLMDTYGDHGNITAVVKRCQWRGIDVKVSNISVGDSLSTSHFDFDFFFFGGGQDIQQEIVGRDLQKKAKGLKHAVEQGSVILAICGGYQLLQNYFKTLAGKTIKGVGIFDAHTIGSTTRMIQNLLIEINPALHLSLRGVLSEAERRRSNLKTGIKDSFASLRMTEGEKNLVGFENHSGKTYLSSKLQPLGTVIKGAGNNGEDSTEGAVYKNAFGCYLHGSLLPKNPHFADYLISKALERRYGEIKLDPLDDSIAWEAHEQAIGRTRSNS